MKAYVIGWKNGKRPEENQKYADMGFDHRVEKATYWETREEAQHAARVFEHWRIVMSSASGGTHVCQDFKVEERGTNEFVVHCEVLSIATKAQG